MEGEATAGSSFAHEPDSNPVTCLRGNGEHNVQMLMTTADGKLLNAIAGYASEKVLLEELALALDLDAKINGKKLRLQRRLVVAAHKKRLADVQQMEFEGVLGQLTEGRLVADRKYCRDHALMDSRCFRTGDMVGNAATFFGSSNGNAPKGRIGKIRDEIHGKFLDELLKRDRQRRKRAKMNKKPRTDLVEI